MGQLSDEQRDAFLAERRVAVLGVGRSDRGPLLAPIWYRFEPAVGFLMCLGASSVKGRRLAAEGRATLCVQAEDFPYRYVVAEGPVTLRPLGDQTREALRAMASRYLGADAGRKYAEAFTTPDELEVTLVPEHWTAVVPGREA